MTNQEIERIKHQNNYVYYNNPLNWDDFSRNSQDQVKQQLNTQCNYCKMDDIYANQPRRASSQHKRTGIPWTDFEDKVLVQLIYSQQLRNWRSIAQTFNSTEGIKTIRTAEQCSQHWLRVLNPHITKGKWSPEEDQLLIQAVQRCSPRNWKQIADLMPGRTDIQIRYRLNRLKGQLINRGILNQEYLP